MSIDSPKAQLDVHTSATCLHAEQDVRSFLRGWETCSHIGDEGRLQLWLTSVDIQLGHLTYSALLLALRKRLLNRLHGFARMRFLWI